MKKLFLLTFCLTFSSLFAQKSIQQVLQNYLDEEKLAGISVMIWQDDQLKINEHAGFQDLESQTPILSQSLFRLASMTKPLTTVAFMKLVEEGKIRLETPLETYIPQYANLKVYKESGEYEELKRPLIMKDLLMHTSGIGSGSLGNTPVDAMIRDHDFSEVKTLAEFVETFAEFPLIHQPGEGFTYSVNTDILARVIELISGQNFGDYLHKNVLKPLKMNHT
ncbi:MAG: beta-lactamase family protein, partial [Bacteroidetes bacterium]|nr:beta-lactamase family protein [Bacteroidota bacterium]